MSNQYSSTNFFIGQLPLYMWINVGRKTNNSIRHNKKLKKKMNIMVLWKLLSGIRNSVIWRNITERDY